MTDFEPGEVVYISTNDPTARIIRKRALQCEGCGGAVYHCEGNYIDGSLA